MKHVVASLWAQEHVCQVGGKQLLVVEFFTGEEEKVHILPRSTGIVVRKGMCWLKTCSSYK
jgi:hypothetical protein